MLEEIKRGNFKLKKAEPAAKEENKQKDEDKNFVELVDPRISSSLSRLK